MKKHSSVPFFLILFFVITTVYSCKNTPAGEKEKGEAVVEQGYPLTLTPDTLGDSLRWHAALHGGKGFTVVEDKSLGYSISNILILPEGFDNKDTIRIEGSDPVEKVYVTDLDGDGKEELFLVTRSAGSGAYAGVTGYGTVRENRPQKIDIGDLTESDKVPEKIKKGLRGHEEIRFDKNSMIISFPLYREEDPNAEPTGGEASVTCHLVTTDGKLQLQCVSAESKE